MSANPRRVLLVDTTLYQPVTPLLEDGVAANLEKGDRYVVFDEAQLHRGLGRLPGVRRATRPIEEWRLRRAFLEVAKEFRPTVVIVCKGSWLDRSTLERCRSATGAVLVNYLTDDPWNPLVTSAAWQDALYSYDVCASTKREICGEMSDKGYRGVVYVPFGYRSAIHWPEHPSSPSELQKFTSDVTFVGTMEPYRAAIIAELVSRLPDVKFRLFGSGWNRHPVLRSHYGGLAVGRSLRLAVQGARVNLSFVREQNRDTISMRTFEIPAMGGLLVASYSEEQDALLPHGSAALYFRNIDELTEQVLGALSDPDRAQRIAAEGTRTIREGSHDYVDRVRQMLEAAGS